MEALGKKKKAKKFFESLNKVNKYAIYYRLNATQKPETREKKIKNIIVMLKNGQKFH
ncbi:MAG: YdeI/OmpD-associated family protein [Candidatus Doudnabacteria bacterium]